MVTRLSGGLTPADGSDPRTFPAIWNVTADEIEAQGTAISGAESDIDALEGKNIPAFGTATPSDGQVLTFDSAGSEFVPEDVATTLADLTDTDISSPVSGEVLEYDGTNWVNATAAGGKILQVVSVENDTTDTTTSGSFVSTSLAATITPSSTSSKIYIVVTGTMGIDASGGPAATDFDIFSSVTSGRLLSTPVRILTDTAELARAPGAINYLDSPATVSAVTYTVQFSIAGAAINGDFRDSKVMTLMEVAV